MHRSYADIAEPFTHRAHVPPDDLGPVTFRWHFQRGLLEPRMSGYELAMFVLGHMPAIVPLLSNHPRVQAEFQAMLVKLATTPKQAIDQVLPWIRSVTRQEEDDVIHMSLYDKTEQPGPKHFVMGGACLS